MAERTVIVDGFSKTFAMTGWRLGYGVMPARIAERVTRLVINSCSCTATFVQDAGVAALTVHCRTALQGHAGPADWQWARRAREVVSIPVLVNGDVRSSEDVRRALDETGCAGVMIGRGAIDHPWIFREARALLDHGVQLPRPTADERRALYLELLAANVAQRGERFGARVTRRHLRGLVGGIVTPGTLAALFTCETVDGCRALLREAAASAA
jgi:tRNA-dihydrouridine synthase